jgi:FlaG/FlaF family flagellin (archaellin)
VIGVILMVAITVILAAVIGAFVLEIGDQQETAPNTSFDSAQAIKYFDIAGSVDARNETMVTLTLAGGNTLDATQTNLAVNGNGSVWTADAGAGRESHCELTWGHAYAPCARPQPNFMPTLGSNERVEITSGESLEAVAYEGWPDDTVVRQEPPQDNYVMNGFSGNDGDPVGLDSHPDRAGIGSVPVLAQGDDVTVVWTASSGGKTQTLFKYSVQ